MSEENHTLKDLKIPVNISISDIEFSINQLSKISENDIIELHSKSKNSRPLFNLIQNNQVIATGELIKDENNTLYFKVKGIPSE